ncbi:MAG: dTMP kinase [Gammaproteobacteria bacterium AqS3]|nr:dTMP kinase [Gammaproteobacteria bacterium AqS3]
MSGRFITFEGIDGSGKTTACSFAAAWLRKQGRSVEQTREPGGSPTAEELRSLLLKSQIEPRAELLLFVAARVENIVHTVAPALAAGCDVICDRYWDSTLAYQVGARGLDAGLVENLRSALDLPEPELTILMDLDPQHPRLSQPDLLDDDHLDNAGLAFQRRIREAFLDLSRRHAERYVVIDANAPLKQVSGCLEAALSERLS